MNKELLLANLREIPNFPIPGILFYDVTTLFKNAECLKEILDNLYEMYKDKGITKVVGIESRGFILGAALAEKLDSIQVHKDAIDENDIVLLHDDLLATGGTMAAAHRLVKKCGAKQTYINFVIELEELNGRKAFPENVEITSLLVK